MRTEQLGAFVEIARQRSLSRASKALHLTQQALSVSMNNLEHEIGTPLLDRSSLGCGLTPAGERFLAFAENFLISYTTLREKIQTDQANNDAPGLQDTGTLNIYCNSSFYFSFHPDIIQNFCREYPGWKVSLIDMPTKEIYERLLTPGGQKEWDIGIVNIPYDDNGVFSPEFAPPKNLFFHPLMRGGYQACISPLSPLAGSKSLSLDTLFKRPMIMGATVQTMLSPLHYLLEKRGKTHFVFSAATPSLWGIMIANNVGVGLLHEVVLNDSTPPDDLLKKIELIPIKEKMEACTGYILSGEPSPIVQAFIALLPHTAPPL